MPIMMKRKDGTITPFRNAEYLSAYYFIPKRILEQCGKELNSIVRQLPDDDRHRLDAQHLTRRQSPMAGDQLIAAVRQRPCQRRGDGSHLADALDHPLHLLVVLHLEGVTLERVQLGQWNIPHSLQFGIVPLRLRGE